MERRIVITGSGIISSIGNNKNEVLSSLRNNKSGIVAIPEWEKYGLNSRVAGTIKLHNINELRNEIGKDSRFMDLSSIYAVMATIEAVNESKLSPDELSGKNIGCIAGSAFSSIEPIYRTGLTLDSKRSRARPYDVPRSMASSCSANICNYLKTKGRCYSISSACATSLHNVGHAYEIIKHGICDIVICGGCEEVSPLLTAMFDGINAISKSFNQDPQKASRPYDQRRDGFVMSGGSGIVILEEYERALRRNASIYGEIVGYGACSDGYNLVQPHPEGLGVYSCISEAMKMANCSSEDIDYLNTHGTSTRLGDISEARAIKKIFNGYRVPLSSTKSISGHGIGAAGVQELIYCLLMMENNFITASSNIEALDSEFEDLDIITENKNTSINTFLTNSFGFGGTNACLIVKKNK